MIDSPTQFQILPGHVKVMDPQTFQIWPGHEKMMDIPTFSDLAWT